VLELIIARMLLPAADDRRSRCWRVERMERRLGASKILHRYGRSRDQHRCGSPGRSHPRPIARHPQASQGTAPAVAAAPPPEPAAPISRPRPPPRPVADGAGRGGGPAGLGRGAHRGRRRSQKAWAVVREAMVRDVHGDEIVLVFQHLVTCMFVAQAELLTGRCVRSSVAPGGCRPSWAATRRPARRPRPRPPPAAPARPARRSRPRARGQLPIGRRRARRGGRLAGDRSAGWGPIRLRRNPRRPR
jgi:hypothetical protein